VSKVKLIVGLGNPGKEYAHNRHNVGYRCINHLAKVHGISLSERSCRAQFGVGRVAGSEVVLAKPRTFMNSSGDSVGLLSRRFGVPLENMFVIHDDLDLPLGRIRFYYGGGSGGHKGIESIIAVLGSREFIRVRVGIGRPPQDMEASQYVLTDFIPLEAATAEEAIRLVGEAIPCALREGLAAAMNRYN
jgi:PTH1 family peptidyl-tRNA hydrolase